MEGVGRLLKLGLECLVGISQFNFVCGKERVMNCFLTFGLTSDKMNILYPNTLFCHACHAWAHAYIIIYTHIDTPTVNSDA